MPQPREWTDQADGIIRDMRAAGETWSKIARRLGLSRNTVIERGRRLKAAAPTARSIPESASKRGDMPLPAGHPATWGAICRDAFPAGV